MCYNKLDKSMTVRLELKLIVIFIAGGLLIFDLEHMVRFRLQLHSF